MPTATQPSELSLSNEQITMLECFLERDDPEGAEKWASETFGIGGDECARQICIQLCAQAKRAGAAEAQVQVLLSERADAYKRSASACRAIQRLYTTNGNSASNKDIKQQYIDRATAAGACAVEIDSIRALAASKPTDEERKT